MRVVLLMSSTPFTFSDIARDGFDAVEFCSTTFAAPGMIVYRAWKFRPCVDVIGSDASCDCVIS